MLIEQIMSRDVKTCQPSDNLNTAARLMWENDCGCIPVVDQDNKAIGIITDRDICMAAYTKGQTLSDLRVETAMSKDVFCCQASQNVREAEELMQQKQIRRVPVCDDDNQVIGLLSLNDIARRSQTSQKGKKAEIAPDEVSTTLAAVSAPRHQPSAPALH